MYCSYKNTEVNCSGNCYGCSFSPNSNPDGLTYPIKQFNYECPDCHGKFNTAVCVNDGTSAFVWGCPFCGRLMEGLR